MKNFLTRYSLTYVRSLVYMLQASEYHVGDFLDWFWRTRDFLHVEERKALVKTPKAVAFLCVGYSALTVVYVFVFWLLSTTTTVCGYLVSFLAIVGIPFVLTYILAVFTVAVRFVQWPVERSIVASAKKKLKEHKGLKIAIAGSYGKTSMREILKTVLGKGKRVSAPPGSYNTPQGIAKFVKGLQGDEEVLIFELGEYYPGDIRKLCDFVQPDMGVITGVNEAHLEKFKDISRTQKTIFELADYLASVIPAEAGIQKGLLYINGENALAKEYVTTLIPPFLKEVPDRAEDLNPSARKFATPFMKERINFYTRAGAGKWKVENAKTSLEGTTFTLADGTQKISAHSHLLGLHQVGPLAAVADIATGLGLTPLQIEQGISETKPFEHRLEPKTDAHGVITLDDSYNGNPDGVRAVIDFLASLKGIGLSAEGRRFYVTPGLVEMGVKTEEAHKEIGRQLASAGIEKVVLIRNSVTPFIEKGLQEGKYEGEIIWFAKALEAFSALPNLTVKGDVVLLQNDWPDQYA